MSSERPIRRRPLKVRGGTLGPFLCWAVVFADIGTSIYYTPGILFSTVGNRAALFVTMTLLVFFLLVLKYAEVAWRYPEGGGVVTVASRALHPFAGLVGGLFIQVDYFLTAALSTLSGFIYLSVVAPQFKWLIVPLTLAGLALLGLLNLMGVKDSARASAAIAVLAGLLQLVVVLLVAVHLGPLGVINSLSSILKGPPLGPVAVVTGYAGAFLAFSGLESISQLAPAMREPRKYVSSRALILVAATMVITSPLLTLWSTTLIDANKLDPNQLISLLGLHFGGALIGSTVAISGALLLVFAGNTAILGSYHVFIALSRMGFLPAALEARNRWRGTPHWSILVSVGVPLAVVALANGNVNLLGDLYAFGLLGAFTLTALALDVVRWHDAPLRTTALAKAGYWLGVLTTVLVGGAWVVNLFSKPLATLFGGGLTAIGVAIAVANVRIGQNRGRPLVLPFLLQPNRSIAPIRAARQLQPAHVLAILPRDPELLDAVIRSTISAADGRPTAFLFRGDRSIRERESGLLEVRDPYLEDRPAQRAFARAEILARSAIGDRRYAYLPGEYSEGALAEMWKQLNPHDTVIAEAESGNLPTTAVSRVRRLHVGEIPVLHLVSGRLAHLRRTS